MLHKFPQGMEVGSARVSLPAVDITQKSLSYTFVGALASTPHKVSFDKLFKCGAILASDDMCLGKSSLLGGS